ncbi:hypothetical protein J5N97_014233 [Dioscorea zingiberensis]|uniref:CCHC-type domain-containing protein n=1 Tax=Dioscorea zingiberensis TaxID=325984 RepID=A0A9D5CTK8_9LILI|nr:hypothetical protein J5N97_014233 [Dioscorea zingiberensis]
MCRHSPPRKRTSEVVVEVCRRCRRPGHLMSECRRLEVCRRCERPGHREKICPIPPSELGTIQLRGGRQTAAKPGKAKEAEPAKGGDLPRAASHNGDRRRGLEAPAPVVEENHHASLSMDSILMAEREALRRCTVTTVVKMMKSLGGSEKVLAAAAMLFEPGLEWASELYGDGRVLIHCPSEKIARELERRKEITFPEFIVHFEPWSFDIDPSEKTSEEIRWIAREGLPTFGRNIDTIARLLKPIGELVHLAAHGPRLIGHFRAMVRIRRGRRFPANIHATILRRKYLVRVELEPGQNPLPWAPASLNTGEDDTQVEDVDRRQKGKLPIGPEGCDQESPKGSARLEAYGRVAEHANCSGVVRIVRHQTGAGSAIRNGMSRELEALHVDDADGKGRSHVAGRGSWASSDGHKKQAPRSQIDMEPRRAESRGPGHAGKRFSHLADPKTSRSAQGHVAQSEPMEHITPQQLDQMVTKKGHVACNEVVDQASSQQIDSYNDATWHPTKDHINNISICTEEVNEKLTKSISDYSKPENINQQEDEVDSDEDYLDPILEREIELEFKALWNSQMEGEESNHSGSPIKEPIGVEPSGHNFTSPNIEPLLNQPMTDVMDPIGPSIQSQLHDHEAVSKSPNQTESPSLIGKQKTPSHSPTKIRGQEITIPGLHPNIDISN